MSVKQNAIHRAISSLGLAVVRDLRAQDERRHNAGLRERALQFQIPIHGSAGNLLAQGSVELQFESPFYYAPGNRDSDFDRPQFKFGPVLDESAAVVISAMVTGWALNEETGGVIGATVTVSAHSPATESLVPFTGYVHLEFQGYAGLREDETDI